jgi:hypothetical protein
MTTAAMESELVRHARQELKLAGMYDEEGVDYGPGNIAEEVIRVIKAFSAGGHSEGSILMTLDIVNKLVRFKPLSPLTASPDEWMEVTVGMWQSRRQATAFSTDGGKTYYDLDEVPRVTHSTEPKP